MKFFCHWFSKGTSFASMTILVIFLSLFLGGSDISSRSNMAPISELLLSKQSRITAEANIPNSEMEALYDLYTATNGSFWSCCEYDGIPWDFNASANPCTDRWQGVTCSFDSFEYYHVTNLTLMQLNLQGTLPSSLQSLEYLEVLSLYENDIFGAIPSSIGNLSALIYLDISYNALNGTIPDTLISTNLSYVNMCYNYLTGSIPDVDFIPGVEFLDLHYNSLSGPIPEYLASLTTLVHFNLKYNMLTGSISNNFGNLTRLNYFVLDANMLSGTIPPSLGNLSNMINLQFDDNNMTGTIPMSLGQLSELVYLYIDTNSFTGTIPDALGNLTTLHTLSVYQNLLTGPIPASLGKLVNVVYFYLNNNSLNGTLPSTLGNLRLLSSLILHDNSISGTIPSSFGDLSRLVNFYVETNVLHGTLPESLGSLFIMENLVFDNNFLTGPIPSSYGKLRNLTGLFLATNVLSGTIPNSLGNLTVLEDLIIDNNLLTGTIPTILGDLPVLVSMYLYNNSVTGPLPASLGKIVTLQALSLSNSFLSGSLSSSLGNLSNLVSFYASLNQLTGTLPSAIGKLLNLEIFYGNDNHLVGTIPGEYAGLSSMQIFAMHNNHLSGAIPQYIGNWPNLLEFMVYNNELSGCLDNIFRPSSQTSLYFIQLNNNQLTGTLPDELFELPRLNTFVAVSNCFHGTLPTSICTCSTMISLILDGMSSATSCRRLMLPGISNSYVLTMSVHGTIPWCITQLPNLTTLHLSGNGFSGSFPSNMQLSSSLNDLSLAHNFLEGPIDDSMQELQWFNLDLSFNRLSGTLKENFASVSISGLPPVSNSSLSLQNNRLSGHIPGSIHEMLNVSILGSNMFSCDMLGNDLPVHNPEKEDYQCGSLAFDIPYYIFMSMALISTLVGCSCWYCRERLDTYFNATTTISNIQLWLDKCKSTSDHLVRYNRVLSVICHVALCSTICVIFIGLPLYWVMGLYYGSYTHEYGYIVSAAFLVGVVPFAVESCIWFCLLLGFCMLFLYLVSEHLACGDKQEDVPDEIVVTDFEKFSMYCCFIVINLVLVGGVNAAYVYAAIYGTSSLLLLEQVLLALFKIVWNRIYIYIILQRLTSFVLPELKAGHVAVEKKFSILLFFVALLNNIFVPCIAVAAISSSCFFNVFSAAPVLSSSFYYQSCQTINSNNGNCTAYDTVQSSTTYNPPFTYSFQCSSSLITYYAPIFVSLCITSAILIPIGKVVVLHFYKKAAPGTLWFELLHFTLPNALKPLSTDGSSKELLCLDANRVMLTLLTNLGLLLTFGVMFPPLAISLALSMHVIVYSSRLTIGKLICNAIDMNRGEYLDVMAKECQGVGTVSALRKVVWMLMVSSCLFYSFFLFDTYGDAIGFYNSYWILIVFPLLPMTFYILYSMFSMLGVFELSFVGDARMTGMSSDTGKTSTSKGSNSIASGSHHTFSQEDERSSVEMSFSRNTPLQSSEWLSAGQSTNNPLITRI